MTKKTVTFHDDPPSEAATNKYKAALKRAKDTQRERPGDLKNTPRFDQTDTWSNNQPESGTNFLSPETKQGLETLARAAKAEARPQSAPSMEPAPTPAPTKNDVVEETKEELSEEDKLRNAIESRLTSIDIGEYLMSGEIRQEVPIIPEKLVVTFKTVSDQEESFVDNNISTEPKTISNRQFLRKMNELALVIHIYSVNGTKWPVLINGDGTINEQSVESRLRHIKKLSSPIFNLMTQNLAWFTDRVTKALTSSALGNG